MITDVACAGSLRATDRQVIVIADPP